MINRTLIITLDVQSDVLSLAEISKLLRLSCASYSHEMGDIRGKSENWMNSLWRYDFGNIAEDLSAEGWPRVAKLLESIDFSPLLMRDPETKISFCLGIIADSVSISVEIPSQIINALNGERINISVSTYPSNPASDDEDSQPNTQGFGHQKKWILGSEDF